MRTSKEIDFQLEQRRKNPPNSPLPPRPPEKEVRQKPTITCRLVQSGREAGKTYQKKKNSKVRIDPFTWFIGTLQLKFTHDTQLQYDHPGSTNISDDSITSSSIARMLAQLSPDSALANNPQNLSDVLAGLKPSRGGWRIQYVLVPKNEDFTSKKGFYTFSVNNLKKIFTIILNLFNEWISENESLENEANAENATNATPAFLDKLKKEFPNIEDQTAATIMYNFLIKRRNFLS